MGVCPVTVAADMDCDGPSTPSDMECNETSAAYESETNYETPLRLSHNSTYTLSGSPISWSTPTMPNFTPDSPNFDKRACYFTAETRLICENGQ